MVDREMLSSIEMASIRASFEAIGRGDVEFVRPDVVMSSLTELWGYVEPYLPSIREAPARYLEAASEWYIGISPEFYKATQHIDRKLQGRIFEAIARISREPTTLKGDTVKPLTSDLKGLWRYRIGDFRLIYYPDGDKRRITLMTFASRGGAYD